MEIRSDLGGEDSWDAKLVRTEGAIDETARQLHVIAQIDDPFGSDNQDHTPIKIGQYVTARLQGKTSAAGVGYSKQYDLPGFLCVHRRGRNFAAAQYRNRLAERY